MASVGLTIDETCFEIIIFKLFSKHTQLNLVLFCKENSFKNFEYNFNIKYFKRKKFISKK